MFYFYVSARKVEIKKTDTLVSDSVNVYPCKFQFSADWNGLVKTAVFRAGTNAIEILLDGSFECNIPWEVLQKHNIDLFVGCYGTKDENIILNTTWTNMGKIYEGTKDKGGSGEEPSPDMISQILSQMGDLSSLETQDKSSLVNAINEVNAKTEEVESNLDTKLDVAGGVATGPIMFAETASPIMTYTFEDEPIETTSDVSHGTAVGANGLFKDSDGPLEIHASSGLIDFDNGVQPATLMGVVGDKDMPTSVPNMSQIPTKVSQLANDSGFITADEIPDIPTEDIPTKVSELENDVGYITASDIPPIPTVPTKTSQLVNDSNFATEQYVQDAIASSEDGGTTDHRDLTNRDANDQHPISAITGLQEALNKIPAPMTAEELREILTK